MKKPVAYSNKTIEAALKSAHKLPKKKTGSASNKPVSVDEYYYPPQLSINEKDFPGVSNFKAGEKVTLVITADVREVRINEKDDGTKKHCAEVVLTSISDVTK